LKYRILSHFLLSIPIRELARPQQPRECVMRKPIASAALSRLIGSIYDCAVEPERWPETLKLIRDERNFAGASLSVVALPSGNVLLEIMSLSDFAAIERTPQDTHDPVEMWDGMDKQFFTG
jgi:hypothetical protein